MPAGGPTLTAGGTFFLSVRDGVWVLGGGEDEVLGWLRGVAAGVKLRFRWLKD